MAGRPECSHTSTFGHVFKIHCKSKTCNLKEDLCEIHLARLVITKMEDRHPVGPVVRAEVLETLRKPQGSRPRRSLYHWGEPQSFALVVPIRTCFQGRQRGYSGGSSRHSLPNARLIFLILRFIFPR